MSYNFVKNYPIVMNFFYMKALDEIFHLVPYLRQSNKISLLYIFSRLPGTKVSSSLYCVVMLSSVHRQLDVRRGGRRFGGKADPLLPPLLHPTSTEPFTTQGKREVRKGGKEGEKKLSERSEVRQIKERKRKREGGEEGEERD